jgi:glycosyltransferase involved in cell wall biosynthesis
MKIAVIGINFAPEQSGIAPYTSRAAELMSARGHCVTVFTTYPHYPQWRIADEYLPARRRDVSFLGQSGVTVVRLRHYVPSNPKSAARLVSELTFGLAILREKLREFDAILLVSPAMFSSALIAARLHYLRRGSGPIGLWVQDIYSAGMSQLDGGSSVSTSVVSRVERWLFRKVDGLLVIHDRFRRYIVSEMGIEQSKVSVSRNWTHLKPAVISSTELEAVRLSMGWGNDEHIVLHSGNMGIKQDLMNVIEAGHIADSTPGNKIRFVLMGGGSERNVLEVAARTVRSVEIIDSVSGELYPKVLAAADVLMVNEKAGSQDVAVPSKLTSYFSSGRPVVAASEAGSATRIEVENSGGGICVAPGDPACLYESVVLVANARSDLAEFGTNATRYVETHLSEQSAADRIDNFVKTLVMDN